MAAVQLTESPSFVTNTQGIPKGNDQQNDYPSLQWILGCRYHLAWQTNQSLCVIICF